MLRRFQLTPIFASAGVPEGGLSLKTYELGIPLSLGGLSLFLYAMLVYKKMQRRFGVKALARNGLRMYAPLAVLFPATSAVLLVGGKSLALGCLCVLTVLRRVVGVNVVTSTTMIVNLSAPRAQLGAVNGFGQSIVALCRALGPGAGRLPVVRQPRPPHPLPPVLALLPGGALLVCHFLPLQPLTPPAGFSHVSMHDPVKLGIKAAGHDIYL